MSRYDGWKGTDGGIDRRWWGWRKMQIKCMHSSTIRISEGRTYTPGRSGHTKGVVNKAKTRDAEVANIVTILSRSDATWSIGRRDYHVDARQQILSDRQKFFSDRQKFFSDRQQFFSDRQQFFSYSTEVSFTTFWYDMLTCERNLLTVRKNLLTVRKKLLTVRKPCQLVWIDRWSYKSRSTCNLA